MELECSRDQMKAHTVLGRRKKDPLNPFTTGNPFFGTKSLGFSIGRGLGALKGLMTLDLSYVWGRGKRERCEDYRCDGQKNKKQNEKVHVEEAPPLMLPTHERQVTAHPRTVRTHLLAVFTLN